MNRQRGQVSTITIVLLIVGLVVGAGGSYFAVSSMFEQKIKDYEATTLSMEQVITTYEGRVADLEAMVEDLQRLSETSTYSIYDMTFEYPEGWLIYPFGLEAEIVKEELGILVVSSADMKDSFYVFWMSTVDIPGYSDIPEYSDLNLNGSFDFISWYVESIEIGEIVNSAKDDHELIYQDYTATEYGGYDTRGTIANWYCEDSERLISIIYRTHEQDELSALLQFLETFICH